MKRQTIAQVAQEVSVDVQDAWSFTLEADDGWIPDRGQEKKKILDGLSFCADALKEVKLSNSGLALVRRNLDIIFKWYQNALDDQKKNFPWNEHKPGMNKIFEATKKLIDFLDEDED